ncbi:MAG TPA: bifunctional diaminohydroxyphosphoribosylaminopyrimidine deaminase/5-amino-6-(5-phosphoribosylamino)uracil reductase RibD [Acidimicrobiales bacterium]|nr:bifunctional diaminohydroxyphosphoribosylaminopyrimidine deaminase/5-amino-6-(5-phosphoribosylamino)uracil reductase RibD [Acidimicrobiales bacterium]
MQDEALMAQALGLAASVRGSSSPNPWVGAVVVTDDGRRFEGATEPPGGAHAEVVALRAAGPAAAGATLVVTLEPCCHHGRTPPCTEAILAAGIRRVVVGVTDPDARVDGGGIRVLREAGIEVVVGVGADRVADQLAPYRKHRRTGRPYVTLKMASTLDGRTAAADGSSRWITGDAARADVHRLRAQSDAVLVGAGTVRADDPELTVRLADGRSPRRVVLGPIPAGAKVMPATSVGGDLGGVLDTLGGEGVVSLLVEGGARVAHAFHAAGLVDRYVFYLAPALMGGSDGPAVFEGPGAASMGQLWRGRLVSVEAVGDDLRVEMAGD